uniref:Uncharacterized protein n=1 Tax=Nelumbo nucifera TaxID=4432 RepID=A0A822XIB6_NELNU|nr:TPA_asm: hypothetical protein HUJ06_021430 [Nelumbo nucifera]
MVALSGDSNTVGTGFNMTDFGGFEGFANNLFLNRSKVLRPLEIFPPIGAQPTLFQKRPALWQNSAAADKGGNLGFFGWEGGQDSAKVEGSKGKTELEEEQRGGVGSVVPKISNRRK